MLHTAAILLIFLLVSASPGEGLAQTTKGLKATEATVQGQQAPVPPGLQHNVGTLAGMMRDIHQLLHQGPLTPKQAQQVSDMMTRLGVMMQEMSGPQAEKYQSSHQRQLEEMKTQLEEIKKQLKNQQR